MTTFKLHVCRNGDWQLLEQFRDRQSAMSMAARLELAAKYSGVKIFQEAPEPIGEGKKNKLVYTWLGDDEDAIKNKNADKYLARIKASRIQKEELARIAKKRRKKIIRQSFYMALLIITTTLGAYGAYLLRHS